MTILTCRHKYTTIQLPSYTCQGTHTLTHPHPHNCSHTPPNKCAHTQKLLYTLSPNTLVHPDTRVKRQPHIHVNAQTCVHLLGRLRRECSSPAQSTPPSNLSFSLWGPKTLTEWKNASNKCHPLGSNSASFSGLCHSVQGLV